MCDPIRTIRNFAIYLLPAFLLATAGALLTAMLYYPAPHAAPVAAESRAAAVADKLQGHAEAEALFAAMLADALRQLQAERASQPRTLMYRYENGTPAAERPVMLRAPPPIIVQDGDSRYPVLVRL